jgi:hypothetical protein
VPRRADDERRRVAQTTDVVEQVDQRGLRMVRIVDDYNERLCAGERIDQPDDRPARVLARGALFEPDPQGDLARHRGRHVERRREISRLQDDLAERRVRRALVRRTAADQDTARIAGDDAQLRREAGLADAGRSENRHQVGRPGRDDLLERRAQARDLLLAPDQRSVEPAPDRWRICVEVEQEEVAALNLGGLSAVPDEPPGGAVHPDLPARGGSGEPLGRTDGLTDHRGCAGGDHLAGAHPAARVEVRGPRDELHRGAQRPLRVVLVRDGGAEDRQHGVVAQLRHDATVRHAHHARRVVVALQDRAQRLGIEARVCELREDARHEPPGVDRERCRLPARRRGRDIVVQDGRLELPQLWRRLDPQALDERLVCVAVGAQRVGRLPGAIEREHLLTAQPLVQRMLGDERLQLGRELDVMPADQVGVDAIA